MKELLYTILELEEWNKETICDFCSGFNKDNKAVCQIRTRSKVTDEIIANDCSCESCKEKFENDEIPKCEKCGRLQTELNMNVLSGKYICNCVRNKENSQDKELPILPHERRPNAFYERQINNLREKLTTAEETIEIEREEVAKFQEKSEEWSKRQKQELLDEIKGLREEVEQLKSQTSEELVNKVKNYETEIEQLKTQLEKLTLQSQVEVRKWPWKSKK